MNYELESGGKGSLKYTNVVGTKDKQEKPFKRDLPRKIWIMTSGLNKCNIHRYTVIYTL